jgi:hypothetical protein
MSISINKKGRTGNNLYQYFIALIISDKLKIPISEIMRSPVLEFKQFDYEKKNLGQSIFINDTNIYDLMENPDRYLNYDIIIDGYFQDSMFFNYNYQFIINQIILDNVETNYNDIVMHVRINDFNRDGAKSNVIHPNWYLEILKRESYEKLYIIIDTCGRTKYRYDDKETNYLNHFKHLSPIIINNNEKADFNLLRSFNKIISSNSTFSWWACFLGNATKIYSPTKWRGKKKLQNIRNISNVIENETCDIHKLEHYDNSINKLNNTYTTLTNNEMNNINQEKRCVVVVSNNNYFHKAKKTIEDIRTTGQWKYNLVFVYGNDISKNQIEELQEFHVIPKYFKDIDLSEIVNKLKKKPYNGLDRKLRKLFCFHKFHLFTNYFKFWDKIFYIDCGMRIFKPIEPFFNINCNNKILANSDAQPKHRWKLRGQFNNTSYPNIFHELETKYKLDVDYFQSTILLYETKIITNEIFNRLIELVQKYFIGFTNDQAIMNLYFTCEKNIWEQVPLHIDNKYLYDYKSRRGRRPQDYIMTKI